MNNYKNILIGSYFKLNKNNIIKINFEINDEIRNAILIL